MVRRRSRCPVLPRGRAASTSGESLVHSASVRTAVHACSPCLGHGAEAGIGRARPWRSGSAHRFGAEVLRPLRSPPGPVFAPLEDPDPKGEDHFGLDPQPVRGCGIRCDRASCARAPNNITGLGHIWRRR